MKRREMIKAQEARRRKLWSVLTENPHQSQRDLANIMGVHTNTIISDLNWLTAAGYITREPWMKNTIRVLIPLLSKEHASE